MAQYRSRSMYRRFNEYELSPKLKDVVSKRITPRYYASLKPDVQLSNIIILRTLNSFLDK